MLPGDVCGTGTVVEAQALAWVAEWAVACTVLIKASNVWFCRACVALKASSSALNSAFCCSKARTLASNPTEPVAVAVAGTGAELEQEQECLRS